MSDKQFAYQSHFQNHGLSHVGYHWTLPVDLLLVKDASDNKIWSQFANNFLTLWTLNPTRASTEFSATTT